MRSTLLLLALTGGPDTIEPPPSARWGAEGHEMAARAAAAVLPTAMPAFFRSAGERLAWLNPEPDRWRSREHHVMDQAWAYDHYLDLENVPPGALDASDRFTFLKALYDAGLEKPERDAGFLPFRMLELYQRLVTEWELWSRETDDTRRSWIEARILNDAGILGHYVTDASQPHHTTIHFNGWANDAPNPAGYTRDRQFHSRFEAQFVAAHVRQEHLTERMGGAPGSVAGEARGAIFQHVLDSHAYVEALYRLDRDVGFDPGSPPHPEALAFAAERLASGARMLAVLWRSAWEEGTGR